MSKATKKGDDVATIQDSPFAVVANPEARDMVMQAVVDMGAGAFDMDRIKMPSSGGEFFSVAGLNGNEAKTELDVVITAIKGGQKAWYRTSIDEGGDSGGPPQCSSSDGTNGFGNRDREAADGVEPQKYECSECPWNQFGSARGGKAGKDCSDSYHMIFFREGAALPDMMVVPASSLKAVKKYLMQMMKFQRAPHTVVTRLTLEVTKNSTGIAYSRLILTAVRDLTDGEVEVFKGLKAPSDTLLSASEKG